MPLHHQLRLLREIIRQKQSSLFYIFILVFAVYSLSFNIALSINPSSDDVGEAEGIVIVDNSTKHGIVKQEQQYSSFFVALLDNPFSSTVLSALAIAVITYVVSKIRSIKIDLSEIPVVKKNQNELTNKIDDLLDKMDERDTKYDLKITEINTKMDNIKLDLDSKIWELVMGKHNNKKE